MNDPTQTKGRPQREPEAALVESVVQAKGNCGAANVNQRLPQGVHHIATVLPEALRQIIVANLRRAITR